MMNRFFIEKFQYALYKGCLLVFCLVSVRGYGQQLPVYSQYTFNAFLLNPAVAGAEGYTSVNVTARNQWIGIDGAPATYCVSLQTRVLKHRYIETGSSVKRRYQMPPRSGRVGLGAYIYRDRIGLMDQTGAEFTYAYHLTRSKSQLSFGITFSLFQFRLNTTELRLPDPRDNLVNNEPMSMIVPDANIGMYYTDQHVFAGFSMFHLTQASVMFGQFSERNFRLKRQYNLTAGFQHPFNDFYTLEPSVYIKISEQWRLQTDLSAKLIYDRKFWIGLGYRNPGMVIGSVGVKIFRFFMGYAYDYSSNPLVSYSGGIHELMLALKLGDNVRRYRWIERY